MDSIGWSGRCLVVEHLFGLFWGYMSCWLIELLPLWHHMLIEFGATCIFRLHLLLFLELLDAFLQFLNLVLIVSRICCVWCIGLSNLLCSMLIIWVLSLLVTRCNWHFRRLRMWHFCKLHRGIVWCQRHLSQLLRFLLNKLSLFATFFDVREHFEPVFSHQIIINFFVACF